MYTDTILNEKNVYWECELQAINVVIVLKDIERPRNNIVEGFKWRWNR